MNIHHRGHRESELSVVKALFMTKKIKSTNQYSRSGFTLVELIVAISLGLFVSTLIFAGYTDLFKGFRRQALRAENVRNMVHIKRGMDHAFGNAQALSMVSARKIVYREQGSLNEHAITYRDSAVYKDDKMIQKGIRDFVFSTSPQKTDQGYCLVSWEALLAHNAWAGGVAVIQEEDDKKGK
jgi:prepilin-type N-terminal cleavage/methylation domain-containing protein